MLIDDFVRYSAVLHRLTVDCRARRPRGQVDCPVGDGFAPFSKQLRHVVCVRGVYNAALASGTVDWSCKHDHYAGPLTREALLAALDDQLDRLLALLKTVDVDASIDWDCTPFTFDLHVGVRAARGDPSRPVERLCLARGVRHATQLANVVGPVKRSIQRFGDGFRRARCGSTRLA